MRAAFGNNSIFKQAVFAAFAEQIPGLDEWSATNINPDGGGYNPYLLSLEERKDLTAKVNWEI
jgi:hypothetical protein